MPRDAVKKFGAPLFALLAFAAFAGFYAMESGPAGVNPPADLRALVAARVAPSVVYIEVKAELDNPPIAILLGLPSGKTIEVTKTGSGFAVNGRIYTCNHVIDGATEIMVRDRAGNEEPASVTRRDEHLDLAELKIAHPPRSLTLRDFPPRINEPVWEIGNPGELLWVTTSGVFVAVAAGMGDNIFVIDTSAGDSGSPIVDASGLVIGMTHAIFSGSRFTLGGTLCDLRGFIYPNEPR